MIFIYKVEKMDSLNLKMFCFVLDYVKTSARFEPVKNSLFYDPWKSVKSI